MDFYRRFTFLVCAPAFADLDLEGLRLQQIVSAIARLGIEVVRAPRFEDAELAVQTDAAIGCMVVDWGKKGVDGKAAALDDSASMSRSAGLSTMFERARDRARALLRQFPSDVDLALLLASAGSSPKISELSPERARVLEALESTACSARPADFASALRNASLILAGSAHAKRRIYLFTDLQAAGWEAGTGLPGQGAPEVIIDDVSGAAPWGNRAVLDVGGLRLRQRWEPAGSRWTPSWRISHQPGRAGWVLP